MVLKRLIFYSIIIVAVILPLNPAFSQTSKDILEIKEGLVRLEEDRKTLSLRIDELDKSLNNRIDGVEKRMLSPVCDSQP